MHLSSGLAKLSFNSAVSCFFFIIHFGSVGAFFLHWHNFICWSADRRTRNKKRIYLYILAVSDFRTCSTTYIYIYFIPFWTKSSKNFRQQKNSFSSSHWFHSSANWNFYIYLLCIYSYFECHTNTYCVSNEMLFSVTRIAPHHVDGW